MASENYRRFFGNHKPVDLGALPGSPLYSAESGLEALVEGARRAGGCIVGSALKIDGDTCKPVDPERAKEFMRLVRAGAKS
jgi:hypothetical protein